LEEGNTGAKDFVFTVSRSGDTSSQASVNWSVAGTGTSPASASDFEGGVLPSGSITFASGESSRTIAVRVAGDLAVESNEGFDVILSSPSEGNLLGSSQAAGSIRNDDAPPAVPGITVSPLSGLTTSESAGSATFTIVLQSRPNADVVIPISSGDTSEGIANVTSLTFTSSNWNTPQTVRVTGVDDTIRDGNVSYTILVGRATSSDVAYNGIDASDVIVVNQDNEKGKPGSSTRGGSKSKISENPISASVATDVIEVLPVSVTNSVNSPSSTPGNAQSAGSSVDAASPVKKRTTVGSGDLGSASTRGESAPRVSTAVSQRQDTSSPELSINLLDQVWRSFE
jgi:hypothetical protein